LEGRRANEGKCAGDAAPVKWKKRGQVGLVQYAKTGVKKGGGNQYKEKMDVMTPGPVDEDIGM